MRGVSLVPLMQGRPISLDAFSETDYRLYVHKRSVRTADGWKFIYSLDTGKKELYHLRDDPGEKNNLINEEPRKAYELEQILLRWLGSMKAGIEKFTHGEELRIKEY
jgi:arylsulfatase A-like enzyme